MTTNLKNPTKLSAKRVILDYSQNSDLSNVFGSLQSYYIGLTKSEITKLALIELFRTKSQSFLPIKNLTDEEEQSLEKAMKSRTKSSLKTLASKQDISNFVDSL